MVSLCKATVEEYSGFNRRVRERSECLKYAIEWETAILFGWDDDEFYELYIAYLESTQVRLSEIPGASATEYRGRPLERVARFFLERGGVAFDIVELSSPGRWQIDGQGQLRKTSIVDSFGTSLAKKIGFQLYLECKNHSEPVSNTDYSRHCQRMGEHCCNFGVMFSTSGYSIGKGAGIAESIYFNSARDIFHVLFTVDIFKKVIDDEKPPLFLVKEVFGYAVNERYRHDRGLQTRYSKANCHQIAEEEHGRYCSESS